MIDIAFAKIENLVPFLHILGVAILLGANINACLMARFVFKRIVVSEDNIDFIFASINRLAVILISSMLLIFISGSILMEKNVIKMADPMLEAIICTKIAVFLFVSINTVYMGFRYKKARDAKKNQDFLEARENLVIILRYFIPLNIVCLCFSIFLGINFRNF